MGQYVDNSWVSAPIATRFWTVKYIKVPSPQYLPETPIPLGTAPPEELSYEFDYWDDSGDGYSQLNHMRMPSGAEYDYEHFMTAFPSLFGAGKESVERESVRAWTHGHGHMDTAWTPTAHSTHTHSVDTHRGRGKSVDTHGERGA